MDEEIKKDIVRKIANGLSEQLKKAYIHLAWDGDNLCVFIKQKGTITFTYRLYNVFFDLMNGRSTTDMVDEVIRSYKKIINKILFKVS